MKVEILLIICVEESKVNEWFFRWLELCILLDVTDHWTCARLGLEFAEPLVVAVEEPVVGMTESCFWCLPGLGNWSPEMLDLSSSDVSNKTVWQTFSGLSEECVDEVPIDFCCATGCCGWSAASAAPLDAPESVGPWSDEMTYTWGGGGGDCGCETWGWADG